MRQEARYFRQLFGRFPTGVAVVLTDAGAAPVGMTVNSLTSVSLDPMLLLFCAHNDSRSATTVLETGKFTVNILAEHQQSVSKRFAGVNEAPDARYLQCNGFIGIEDALAVFCCDVKQCFPGGDHKIIVGEVMDMIGGEEAESPLIYFNGGYQRLGDSYPSIKS